MNPSNNMNDEYNRHYRPHWDLIKPNIQEYARNISEGLIHTLSLGRTVYMLKKQIPEAVYKFDNTNNTLTAYFKSTVFNKEIYDKFKVTINNLGWFISKMDFKGFIEKYKPEAILKLINQPSSVSIGLRHFVSDILQLDVTMGESISGEIKIPLYFSIGIRAVTGFFNRK
jgi:hypothetical protein